MKIKRIDICGFKSFVEKTSISFPDPITAVVGPNGCGKSNIVDAIRWVMGEQSAKHLRGRSMEDVIFAGSETRGPMGMAEVSLTFDARALAGDAAPGGVPWGQMGPEEVVVTRRLYRAGDSEYLLNGVPCRLRDVVEFFLGTGVGSKAYAIIEQGRIGFIVSSRPEDRRGLFDEAAGITKYKAKKRAAERRMEQTRQALEKVTAVIGEIEGRLKTLRLQAQKAARYKRYREELREIELWSASQEYLGFLVEEKALHAELGDVRERHERGAVALAAEDTSVEAERLGVTEELNELAAAKDQLFELQNRGQLAQQRAQHYEDEAGALLARAGMARKEIAEIEAHQAETAEALAEIEGQLARVDEDAESRRRELEARQATHDGVRRELSTARAELDARTAEAAGLRARIARNESEAESARARRGDLLRRLDEVTAEDAAAVERVVILEAEAEGLRRALADLASRRDELLARRGEAEARQGELRQKVAHGEMTLETLREQGHKLRSRMSSLMEIQDRYESFQRGVRAIMQKHKEGTGVGIKGVVADIVQPPPELETAVEAVLGERLGNIIVESHEVGVEAIEFLKQRSEGRSSFIPMAVRGPAAGARMSAAGADGLGTVVFDAGVATPAFVPWPTGEGVRGPLLDLIGFDRQYDRVAAYLLGDVVVVEDLRRALELWRQTQTDKTIVTLDGEVIDPHGVVTGGSRESAVGVLSQKREIRELEELVAKIDADYKEAFERHVSFKQELAEITRLLDELASAGRTDEVGMVTRQKDLDRAAEDIGRHGARRLQLAAQAHDLRDAAEQAASRYAEASAALDGDRGAADAADRAAVELRGAAGALGERVDALVGELTALRVAAAQAEDRRAAAREGAARLRREREEATARATRLAVSAADEEARVDRLRLDARTLRDEAALLHAEAEERVRAHTERHAAVEERQALLSRREAELRVARAVEEQLTRELTRLELRHQEVTLKRQNLETQTTSRYRDVALPAVVFDYHMRPPVGPIEDARAQELRELIERMGGINLQAIEESDELQKRFDFLTTQRADLDSAVSQLESAIEKINRASRKRFRETFDAVNAKFQEVFPRLFKGGRAHLQLTDENDLLETGVEIIANPPGKKVMQNIELLSGGEKALTAVSLLFAIFLVKPSPFCLLDEVDAPLDEANVGRFNEVVREMTDRSQFIVITHNRRTMEIADRLCGITMEEPGVSKLVSVTLRGGRIGRANVETQSSASA